jgi:hypothetical protein
LRPTHWIAAGGAAIALVATAWAAGPTSQPKTTGRLSTFEGLTVLEVWGSPEEAGFAHGCLLAEAIVRLFDEAVVDAAVGVPPDAYEAVVLPSVRQKFAWSAEAERELAGMLKGVRTRLGPDRVRSEKLARELTVDDLKVANALADWRGVLCSSFTAWGALTRDGAILTGRNLDYRATESMKKNQVVIIRRADGARPAWIGVAWPSLIGAYSAMNAEGVTIAMHDAGGLPTEAFEGLTPRALVLREALEAAHPRTFLDDVRRVLERRHVLAGNNIHVSGPGAEQTPAGVFEYDGNARDHGVTLRLPRDNQPALADALCCTNHMRVRKEPTECGRYATLATRLGEMSTAKQTLDAPAALELIRSVATKTTLHSIVFLPQRHALLVQIAAIQDKPVEFRLDEWLQREVPAP